MARQILISLRGTDRIEEVLPYVERSVHTGVKVVFVVHYGLTGFRELMDQLLAHQKESRGELFSNSSDSDIAEDQRLSADRRILFACRRLVNRGAEIDVIVYGCTLSAVLEKYLHKEEVELIPAKMGDENCGVAGLGKNEPISGRAHLGSCFPPAPRPEKLSDRRSSN